MSADLIVLRSNSVAASKSAPAVPRSSHYTPSSLAFAVLALSTDQRPPTSPGDCNPLVCHPVLADRRLSTIS